MIQRIQTVFLLLALVFMGLFLWMPLIQLEMPHIQPQPLQGWQITHRFPFMGEMYIYYVTAVLTGTAIGLTFINIFLFKNRKLQMLICWFAILFIVFAQAYVYYEYQTKIFFGDVVFRKWNILSLGAVLFEILAFAYIRKDEETVKSLDRLR
jgi:hypothetical protein